MSADRPSAHPDTLNMAAEAVRTLAEHLFAHADRPPHPHVVQILPDAHRAIHTLTAHAAEAQRTDLSALLDAILARIHAGIAAAALSDEHLVDLAEQFDQLVSCCQSPPIESIEPSSIAAKPEPVAETGVADPVEASIAQPHELPNVEPLGVEVIEESTNKASHEFTDLASPSNDNAVASLGDAQPDLLTRNEPTISAIPTATTDEPPTDAHPLDTEEPPHLPHADAVAAIDEPTPSKPPAEIDALQPVDVAAVEAPIGEAPAAEAMMPLPEIAEPAPDTIATPPEDLAGAAPAGKQTIPTEPTTLVDALEAPTPPTDETPGTAEPVPTDAPMPPAEVAAPSAASSLNDILELDTDSGAREVLSAAAAPSPARPDQATSPDLWTRLGITPIPPENLERPLGLNAAKQDLLKYMIPDLHEATAALRSAAQSLSTGDLPTLGARIQEIGAANERTTTFFNHETLIQSSQLVSAVGAECAKAADASRPALADILLTLADLWTRCGDALTRSIEERWPLSGLMDRIAAALVPDAPAPSDVAAPAPADEASTINPTNPETLELPPEQLQALIDPAQQATWGSAPLSLPADKADLVQFLVNDVRQAAEALAPLGPQLGDLGARDEVCGELRRLHTLMEKATRDFNFTSLNELIQLVGDIAFGLPGVTDVMLPELTARLLAIASLIQQHATALEVGMETTWPLQTLRARIHRTLEGQSLAPQIINWHKGDPEKIAELDGIVDWGDAPPKVDPAQDRSDWKRPAQTAGAQQPGQSDVVRVETRVIDGLMMSVGEMVQHRARLQMLAEQLRNDLPGNATAEELFRTSEILERSMVTVQTGIMGTRMVPMGRLFDNYPRVLRDVARLAGREVDVRIAGADTLVDKSIVDLVAEPLMLLLRYAAARMIETPDQRKELGKPPVGNVSIAAAHQGSQVVISIQDDGRGFDRNDAIGWIVESGLMTDEQAQAVSPDELATMLLESETTASPLREVAEMLRTSVGGTAMIRNTPGTGARIDVIVPMKSAILAAVLVAVGQSSYTLPLQAIMEITRIEKSMVKTIGGAPSLRVRDDLFPLLDARTILGDDAVGEPAFALIVTTGQTRAALGVDRVISKQDMIIRQIDDACLRRGPFSGTTLTREGRVSLVLDVQRILSAAADPATAHHNQSRH